MNALYNPANDSTRNIPAGQSAPQDRRPVAGTPLTGPAALGQVEGSPLPVGNALPTPENGTGEGLRWYRVGVEAVGKARSEEALRAFRRSYAFQAELDAVTRQQLYDHLKILGEPVEPLQNVDGGLAESAKATAIPTTAAAGPVKPASAGAALATPGIETQASLAPALMALAPSTSANNGGASASPGAASSEAGNGAPAPWLRRRHPARHWPGRWRPKCRGNRAWRAR